MVVCSFSLSIFLYVLIVFITISAQIGVCYGMLGDNLLSKSNVIALYNQNNIRKMRIYVELLESFYA
ncbi:hypothetical protein CUMW_205180 [Citrus unshiu]|uniref:glucan endo-1,3-beta-D-glucosidase n=1 Tax=Citrus unshiu TaxID=55188 RepID=A0A2H5Q864_CITUN|nr:hypothetical protein CUMW_205180 [Citrus unshiu]